jgi:hypothetical protein
VYVPALHAKLNAAEQQYAECLPLVGKGQDALQQHVADVQGLREALATQRSAQQQLAQRLKAFRDRREVDPHWQAARTARSRRPTGIGSGRLSANVRRCCRRTSRPTSGAIRRR